MTKRSLLCFSLLTWAVIGFAQNRNAGYYTIEKINLPEGVILEGGGAAFNDKGQLGVITRRGELWLIDNPASANPTFSRFAHGLHEPLGLAFRNGSFYANQRGELTKITDTNGDGRADLYEPITTWELSGNYHEYSYGPLFLPDGEMLVTLNLGWKGRGVSESKWRGWMLKVSEDGQVTPWATGLRSPAGFGVNAAGDIFYTENQGDWVGSGRMTHLEHGDFAGSPEGLRWTGEPDSPLKITMEDIVDTIGLSLYDYQEVIPAVKPPSVWFPHTLMGISTSDFKVFSNKMGPFEGQLMVGDQGHSKIMRVYQEKVNGVYQGICFPFVEGFSSGVIRLCYSPEKDAIYVAQTARGWASSGGEDHALERLTWTGRVPFDMKTVQVQPNGFKITFTQPVDKASAANPDSYAITDFTYLYHHFYGSPVQQKESRIIREAKVADDGMSAELTIDRFRLGFVYEIRASGVRNAASSKLLNDYGYYTLNEVPEGSTIVSDATGDDALATASSLRVTTQPADWDKPDVVIELGTLPGLKFDQSEFRVKAGDKIKWTFANNDDMLHNVIIVNPGKADEVGEAAQQLGLDGETLSYIPKSDEILAHTNLLHPDEVESIYFTAPRTPGRYEYVCTFPGHHMIMRGVLVVE